MKRVLLIVIFTSNCLTAWSQGNVAWPDSASMWVNTASSVVWPPQQPYPDFVLNDVDYYCMYGLDTTIAGETYGQIHYCGEAYKGAMREVGRAIYFVPRDSVSEYLLYDFNVTAGDTINDVYIATSYYVEGFGLFDLTVNSIDTILAYGQSRTMVQFSGGGAWIEGIGCPQGLFAEPWPNISNYVLELECFSHLDSTYDYWATTGYPGTCPLNVGIEQPNAEVAFTLYPNPTTSTITLQTETPLRQAWLTDLAGRRLMPLQPNGTQWQADLSALPAGIYLIEAFTEDGARAVKKVVRE